MKAINKLIFSAVILISFSLHQAACQEKAPDLKVKSRITHEEKTVKGIKSNLIEAEEKYDSKGNVTEEIEYKDGKIDKHFVYEYDANNNKVKETELDPDGKLKKYSEFKYENGLRTEKNTYGPDKKLISKKTYTYTY